MQHMIDVLNGVKPAGPRSSLALRSHIALQVRGLVMADGPICGCQCVTKSSSKYHIHKVQVIG